jgi:RNA binding exosome subunit
MANSFDKQKAINDIYDRVADAERVVTAMEQMFANAKASLTGTRNTVNANANGYFTNPDDLTWLDGKISALKARVAALGA